MRVWMKTIAVLLALLLAVSAVGCTTRPDSGENGKVKIVCTVFPLYDWVREVAGEKAEVSLLLTGNTDLHSYQPTAADIVAIASADVFVYIGGESDRWVTDVLKTSGKKEQTVLALSDVLADRMLHDEDPEGAEHEHEHEHEHDEDCEHGAYDEHIWLSLKNAVLSVEAICETLCELDAEHSEEYRKNAEAYTAELEALDAEYTEMAENAERNELLFGDRFPFRYLAEDYGWKCYAAFPGCSSETDASFETIIRLAGVADSQALAYVLVTESSDKAVAKSICENTKTANPEILTLDSMQSVSSAQMKDGVSYRSVMEQNLEILRTALNAEKTNG